MEGRLDRGEVLGGLGGEILQLLHGAARAVARGLHVAHELRGLLFVRDGLQDLSLERNERIREFARAPGERLALRHGHGGLVRGERGLRDEHVEGGALRLREQRLRCLVFRARKHLLHVQIVVQRGEARHRAGEVAVGARVVRRLAQGELHHLRAFVGGRARAAQGFEDGVGGVHARGVLRLRKGGVAVGGAQRAHDLRRARAVRAAQHEPAQRGERVRGVARRIGVVAAVPQVAVGSRRSWVLRRGDMHRQRQQS